MFRYVHLLSGTLISTCHLVGGFQVADTVTMGETPFYHALFQSSNLQWQLSYYAYESFIDIDKYAYGYEYKNVRFPVFSVAAGGQMTAIVDLLDVSATNLESGSAGDPLSLLVCSVQQWTLYLANGYQKLGTSLKVIHARRAGTINDTLTYLERDQSMLMMESLDFCTHHQSVSLLRGSTSTISINFDYPHEAVIIFAKNINYTSITFHYDITLLNRHPLNRNTMTPLSAFISPIPTIYLVLTIAWIIFCTACVRRFFLKQQMVPLQNGVASVILLRTILYLAQLAAWSQASITGRISDGLMWIQFVVKVLAGTHWLFIFLVVSKGWGIQVDFLARADIAACLVLASTFSLSDTLHDHHRLYDSHGQGANVLFATWVFCIVYFEHVIRSGAIATIYCSNYLAKLKHDRPVNAPEMEMYSIEAKDKSGMNGLIRVYENKEDLQRALWITGIVYAAAQVLVQCMRFFSFLTYVPVLYVLMTEFLPILVIVRITFLLFQAPNKGQVLL